MKIDLTVRGFEADDKVRRYLEKKIGRLERFLSRRGRQEAVAEVVLLHDHSASEPAQYTCEAIITVPGEKVMSKESTINIYAAIDIVEAKLRVQLTKHKAKHTLERRRNRMLWRVLGRTSETDPQTPDLQPEG